MWPERSVLYNFHGKRTIFPFWREFQAKVTILRTLTLQNQNVLRMTWKERFVQFSWKAHCFPDLKRISGQCDDFKNFDAQKCDLAKTCWAWPKRSVLYNFHGRRTVLSFWKEFQARVTILRTLTLQNAIWPKPTKHDLKRAFCTVFMKTTLLFRFEENLRPVSRFWELWRSKTRFGQNVLRMTWKADFVQFSWKAHCFSVLKRILGQFHDFENFDAQKCDLAKTCCAWPEKRTLYNFHGKRTVFPFWIEFQASFMILKTLTLKNAIWPKRAAHDLKRAFCTIFMENTLFSRFEENLRLVWRLGALWRSKMRFGQNVLRMTWKERFVQFSWKVHCFPVLTRISGEGDDFKNFDAQKCDLAKKSYAWPEKSVLYNFHGRRTVFPFWREFQAKVTILRTLPLQNAIWPKRAAHDLKRAFWTILMKNALFSRFEENFRQVRRFYELWRSKMRTVFLFWRNAHDLKSALFFRFEENLRPVSRV